MKIVYIGTNSGLAETLVERLRQEGNDVYLLSDKELQQKPKGKHKPEIQKLYEELEECGRRLMEYKECFEIMGKDRNSYSKRKPKHPEQER